MANVTHHNRDKVDLSALDDAALVRRFLDGDRGAFEQIALRYQHGVYRFVCMFLANEREDAAQEVFLQLYASLHTFRAEASLRTWIFSVTRNVCRRSLRSARGMDTLVASPEDDEALLDIADQADNIEKAALSREVDRVVKEAMAKLEPIHREVLILRDWERLGYQEIAQALGIPIGTVRSRLHNATARLAGLLQAYASEARS